MSKENFEAWNQRKQQIQERKEERVYFSEREIWWCSIGQNIGTEMNGKHFNFERPVLIVRKINRRMFLGIPCTTKGSPSQLLVPLTSPKDPHHSFCSIYHVRSYSSRRLLRKIGTVKHSEFFAVRDAIDTFTGLKKSGPLHQETLGGRSPNNVILPSANPLRKSETKNFQSYYTALNPEQKRAVDAVEGPVMVIAGPGTGKTQVLAMRTANILKKTQAKPSNILCLTFSTSGATAMRERLRTLIGSEAYVITISTIHGFCNEIIQQHPIVFDDWSTLEQISDIEQYRTLNKIIEQHVETLAVVNKKNPYYRTRDFLARFSELKREGKVERGELMTICDAYDEVMSTKSREGTKIHEKNLLTARKFREFVELFLQYQEALQTSGRYDYDDMILTVNRALREEDWLLASLQERYQYILVDEFQDTNGAQYDCIDLLTTPRTPEDRPNLFIVGDDDQAIYRFQGANLTNILRFHRRFPDAEKIVLKSNYRSSQQILNVAMNVIDHNTDRLIDKIPGLEKKLIGRTEQGPDPILLRCPSDEMEPWPLADLVQERIDAGVPAREIAILTKTNAELRPIYDVLRARGIPVEMTGTVDLLQHPLVRQVISIFRAGLRPQDDSLFAGALGAACFGCSEADLGRLYDAVKRAQGHSLHSYALHFGHPVDPDPVVLHKREQFLQARDTILAVNVAAASSTVLQIFEQILKLTHLVPSSPENLNPLDPSFKQVDPLDLAALTEFFSYVRSRSYEQQSFSHQSFLADLEYYMHPEYGQLRLTYALPHLTDEGVQLMTAHKSKGLEFEVVILTNFREKHWHDKTNPSGVSVPEDLLYGLEKDQKSYEKDQDERRIAFVAMTRAKRELIMTCPVQLLRGSTEKTVSPAAYIAEGKQIAEAHREIRDSSTASLLIHQPVRVLDLELQSFLRHRLKDYALSVTALNHFLEDPYLFLESDLLQIPQSKQLSLVYGNAVHDALRRWGMDTIDGREQNIEQFLCSFRTYLQEREVLTDAERAALLALGNESLPRYYHERLEGYRPSILAVEKSIGTHIGDIRIKGKLDRIDAMGINTSDVMVLDFKTGKPKTDSEIRKPSTEGGYMNQLVFYALLIRHGMPHLSLHSCALDFVGEGTAEPVLRTYQIAQEQEKELLAVVTAVWTKIHSLDFTKV